MALTKYFVILFLVYLNFDISPLHSAAIPEKLDSPDSVNTSEDITNSENYSTTGPTEDDIEKIFETYENLYIKNSNWFNDETPKNVNIEKSLKTKTKEEESTSPDLGTTEPTADDVVESIHNIMDEKIDAKKNRTDRTIVVVVTTNVFNINGSDDSNKRQHTLLSFGTPGMIQKETSTDATLAMHNKITTEFFNSNPSPITEQSGTIQTNYNQKSIVEDTETIASHDLLDDSLDDSEKILPAAVEDELADVATTEKPTKQSVYDDEQVQDIQSSNVDTMSEGRSFDGELSNNESNDILRIVKIIPNRSDDESSSGGLSKPFEIPIQETQDSSLMEAIENILDTDVRKAFERDIPQTRHVPLDINIEEETLYAPLKDLSEYIVEEVPINGNYDIFKNNFKIDDKIDTVKNAEEVESIGKKEELSSHLNYHDLSNVPAKRVENLTYEPEIENEPATTTTTTEEATTTIEEETKIVVTEAAIEAKTTITEEETAGTSVEFDSNAANKQIEDTTNSEDAMTTKKSDDTFDVPIIENNVKEMPEADKNSGEEPERVEIQQRSELVKNTDSSDDLDVLEEKQSIVENNTEIHEEIPESSNISPATNSDGESSTTLPTQNVEYVAESIGSDRRLQNAHDGASESMIETFKKLVDNYFDQYPIYVDPDTTTEYVTNPNLYIGALLTNDQVAAILEAQAAKTVSNVDTTPFSMDNVEPLNSQNFVNTQNSYTDVVLSNGEVTTLLELEDKLDEAISQAELEKTVSHSDIDELNYIELLGSTTAKPDEDVVSEVVKVDEETTEQHQIIKKPGVDGTINETVNDDVESKLIKVTNIETNDLVSTKTTSFESRSFSDDDDPVDPLRTLVEGVELTADITKMIDNFQSFNDPNDSIHFAANQVIESKDNMALVKNDNELNSIEESIWCATAKYVYITGGVLSLGLIVLLGVVSYLRFRQFKRNILFTC